MSNNSNGTNDQVVRLANMPRFTGRRVLTLPQGINHNAAISSLSRKENLNIANSRDFDNSPENFRQAFADGDGIYFDSLKIAIVNEDATQGTRIAELGQETGIVNEAERYMYALSPQQTVAAPGPVTDALQQTWGVSAVNLRTLTPGKNINIAVLDTGIDLSHPDFAGLSVQHNSFVTNETVNDGHGHGTHCCGVAVAAIQQSSGLRYGIANAANLFVGKVLSNSGRGDDAAVFNGIEWALRNKCNVISMSFGSLAMPNETFIAYETLAQRALQNNCLLIAAAGNESHRPMGPVAPVTYPASCSSIMAVGALDQSLQVASFSCAGLNLDGGRVDLAGPGVSVFSSYKNNGYAAMSGTSMATPFVAGIAASYFAADPSLTAFDVWSLLIQRARKLNLPIQDVGAGLVQAI
jgi:subtilisin family serine protease